MMSTRLLCRLCLAACALAPLLIGGAACAESSPRDTPEGTYEAFRAAFAEGNYEGYLAMMTEEFRADYVGTLITRAMAVRALAQQEESEARQEHLRTLDEIMRDNGVEIDLESLEAMDADEDYYANVYERVDDPAGLLADVLEWLRALPGNADSGVRIRMEGTLTELEMDSARARGKLKTNEERTGTVEFALVEGRWSVAGFEPRARQR